MNGAPDQTRRADRRPLAADRSPLSLLPRRRGSPLAALYRRTGDAAHE
jgi:hypothetical protein